MQNRVEGQLVRQINIEKQSLWDFPGGAEVKNPPYKAGDLGSVSDWEAMIMHAMKHGQNKKKSYQLLFVTLNKNNSLLADLPSALWGKIQVEHLIYWC